jgi:hypothetical protein
MQQRNIYEFYKFFVVVPIQYEIKLTATNNDIFSLHLIKYFNIIKRLRTQSITYQKK